MKRNRPSALQLFEQQWICPITSMPMTDPVITFDGHSYEKAYILEWFKKEKTSPKTGLKLESETIVPNLILKNVIHRFQNEIKYEFQKMTKQIGDLISKNKQLQNRLKSITQQRDKLLKERTKAKDIPKDYERLRTQLQKFQTDNDLLNDQVVSLKLQNDQLLKHVYFLEEKAQVKQKDLEYSMKIALSQLQPQKAQELLPPDEYLMNMPVLYDQQQQLLSHEDCAIDMDFFLMHDWSHVKTLNLQNTQINDEGFAKLTQSITRFKSLKEISLLDNPITNITKQSLQNLKHLKVKLIDEGSIQQIINQEPSNSLSSESLNLWNEFQKSCQLI